MDIPSVQSAPIKKGTTVFVRVDFNVPIESGTVRDPYRIDHTLRTIQYLRDVGAKIVLASHLKTDADGEQASLEPVAHYLHDTVAPVSFIGTCVGPDVVQMIDLLAPGDMLLLENLRRHEEETVNDSGFARQLAECVDIYVNEAFSVSHRNHASIVGMPDYLPSFAGFQFLDEVTHLSEAFDPPAPFVFCLGGAKFDTKIPLIQKFVNRADTVFIGGALANDLFVAQGYEVGTSLVSPQNNDITELLTADTLVVPHDVITDTGETKSIETVDEDEAIMDAGAKSVRMLARKIHDASFVVWNGPLGDYEHGYTHGTSALAKGIGQSNARSIVGGGDTLASIKELNILDQFSFVSTGGGAMLDFLAHETLPGIQALQNSSA